MGKQPCEVTVDHVAVDYLWTTWFSLLSLEATFGVVHHLLMISIRGWESTENDYFLGTC